LNFCNSLFSVYWLFLGRPISRGIGYLVDLAPFAVSELILQLGILACIIVLFRKWRYPKMKTHRFWLFCCVIPVIFLFSQGATPVDFVPTAIRPSLHSTLKPPALPYDSILEWLDLEQESFLEGFDSNALYSMADSDVLNMANYSVSQAQVLLGELPGRWVHRIKPMWGISRLLGFAYGGPGYHDVITGEVVLPDTSDLPVTQAFRIFSIVHEVAHAHGWTREMDAEIVTFLALRTSPHPVFVNLSSLFLLRKFNYDVEYPEAMTSEIQHVIARRREVRRKQFVVNLLESTMKKVSLRNAPEKYGSRSPEELWNPHHPFFSTVYALDYSISL
jgi:hypothetical protein